MLDCIMQGSSKKSLSNTALNKDENTRTESTNSDINLTLKSSSPELHDSLTSSKDAFSDDNYDDAFKEHCTKCMTRLSQDSMCPACNKDIFPSHAATPRKHLSPGRFYSSKKVRTYPGTKKCGTGVPRLCAAPDTKPSTTKKSVGSSQATSGRKKRKNQRKVSWFYLEVSEASFFQERLNCWECTPVWSNPYYSRSSPCDHPHK